MTKSKSRKSATKLGSETSKRGSSVTVRDSRNGEERVYSLKEHGKEYLKLAKEFAAKVISREIV